MRKSLGKFVLTVLVAGITAFQGVNSQTRSGQCDRKCLEGFVNRYLDAMVAHDASKAPLAENVKFTENAKVLSLAKPTGGLWVNSSGLSNYKFYIADPQAGQVAFVGLVKEGQKNVLLSMRLKVEKGRITEAESIVVRNLNQNNLWTLIAPPAAFSEPLAPDERVSREELVKISNLYFDGIVQLTAKNIPFHDECYRLENGMWTAGPKLPPELAANMPKSEAKPKESETRTSSAFAREACHVAIDSGVFALIESITPRHTPVVDEERGVTWGVYMFNHPGVETIKAKDGTSKPAAYFRGQPNSMPMSELFKIKKGKIRDIMAIGVVNPYRSGSGWE
jgi:hypothetical protein